MALSRIAMLKNTTVISNSTSTRRLVHHFAALPPPISGSMDRAAGSPPPCILPENDNVRDLDFGFGFSSLPVGEGMEVMAVPKRKVTPHKKGIRNGPKALKPIPVIIRCKSCGRVKLPHFYCCSGDRGKSSENSDRTN